MKKNRNGGIFFLLPKRGGGNVASDYFFPEVAAPHAAMMTRQRFDRLRSWAIVSTEIIGHV